MITRWAADTSVTSITSTLVTSVVALLIGVFGGGTLAALLRVKADRGKVVIEAAQGAVIVQTSVIDDLQAELQRVKGEMASMRADRAAEREQWEAEMAGLRRENAVLRQRMVAVEQAGDGEPA